MLALVVHSFLWALFLPSLEYEPQGDRKGLQLVLAYILKALDWLRGVSRNEREHKVTVRTTGDACIVSAELLPLNTGLGGTGQVCHCLALHVHSQALDRLQGVSRNKREHKVIVKKAGDALNPRSLALNMSLGGTGQVCHWPFTSIPRH